MSTQVLSLGVLLLSVIKTDLFQILSSLIFGFTIICVVGFAPMEAVHNAAHDTRHTEGFPCH